ncbi:MAG TPA: hypothetical protein VGK73_00845 [Polyangiaceae bacterium]
MSSPRLSRVGLFALLGAAFVGAPVHAAESRERQLSPGEIESWLDAEPGTPADDQGTTTGGDEPLPAPRRHGLVLESGVGMVWQVGALKNITPAAPLFQLRVGYEFFDFLMPFLEGDVAFCTTAYASEPPPPRSYWHFGFGAGARATLPVGRIFAVFAQGSLGFARVSEQNVLSIYGFPDADELNLYFGGELGFEWYQINPHLALAVHGGVRYYGQGLTREQGGGAPLATLGSLQLRYAF